MMSNTDLLNSFYNYLFFEKRSSEHTVNSYKIDLNQFNHFILNANASLSLLDCSHRDLRNWIIDLGHNGLESKTLARKVATLKSFYKYLLKTGEIEHSPANKLKSPKLSKKLPEVIKEKELAILLDNIAWDKTLFSDLTSKIIVELLYHTGMRQSELINLKESDINFQKREMKVYGKGSKERIIPFGNSLKKSIEEFLSLKKLEFQNNNLYLIVTSKGNKSYPMFVYRAVKTALGNVTSQTKRSPHILRHSFATHLLDKGADLNAIKELLGHTSLAATQVYTHNSLEKLKDVFSQAHPKA